MASPTAPTASSHFSFKNWRSWIYLGSPLTPNALNNGKANFPEYHNVYIEPGSFEIYKKTGEFPDGTIMFKELQRVLEPPQSGTARAPSRLAVAISRASSTAAT